MGNSFLRTLMKNKIILNHQLISAKELSRRTGYTNDYISRLCRFGKVEGQKIGNSWYADELSLKKFIDQQENKNKNWNEKLSKNGKIEIKARSSQSVYVRTSFNVWQNSGDSGCPRCYLQRFIELWCD